MIIGPLLYKTGISANSQEVFSRAHGSLMNPIKRHPCYFVCIRNPISVTQGRGNQSFPRSSGDISISHLGVSRGHRNVPHTSHGLFKVRPDSSALRNPLPRTLLLDNGSFLQDPLSLSGQSNYSTLAYLPTELCTPQCVRSEQ